MSNWNTYKRKGTIEMRPYDPMEGELPSEVSISEEDIENGSPKEGDMIARDPNNHNDKWLVSKDYAEKHYERISNRPKPDRTGDSSTPPIYKA